MKNKNIFSPIKIAISHSISRSWSIDDLLTESERIIDCYCTNPDPRYLTASWSFSRTSKLGLKSFTQMLIASDARDQSEMSQKMAGFGKQRVSSSAITQTKAKIRPIFFRDLFLTITQRLPYSPAKGQKYRFIAIDGSNLPIIINRKEPEYLIQRKKGAAPIRSGYHMNLMMDLDSGIFLDMIPQSQTGKNERKAAAILIEHYRIYYDADEAIPVFVMDRGYFSYKIAALCDRFGYKYVIRTKTREFRSLFPELTAQEGIQDATKTLSCHQNRKIRANPRHKYVMRKTLEAIKPGLETMEFSVRGISIELKENEFEYLLTNLDDPMLDIEDYRDIYHNRWEIETKIGQLKYGAGLKKIHSKKAKWVEMEIYAVLIRMNLTCAAACIAFKKKKAFKSRKSQQHINLTKAVRTMAYYLQSRWSRYRTSISESDLIGEILRDPCCIRNGRSFSRKLHPNRVIGLCWR